jgi:hypothetical protein
MYQVPWAKLLERGKQLVGLIDIIIPDHIASERQITRGTAKVFDVGFVTLRVLVQLRATASAEVSGLNLKWHPPKAGRAQLVGEFRFIHHYGAPVA